MRIESEKLFSKTGRKTLPSAHRLKIAGNYERVASILRHHTTASHIFSRYPYVRPFQKLRARIEEQRVAWLHRSPVKVLDGLIRTLVTGTPASSGRDTLDCEHAGLQCYTSTTHLDARLGTRFF